jgi:DNA-binding HxlR family transcriptional regulator
VKERPRTPLSRGESVIAPEALGRFEDLRRRAESLARDFSPAGADAGPEAGQITEANLELARAVFGKWTMEILVVLFTQPSAGFEELRRYLRTISPRVLSAKLKMLEGRGLVVRTVLNDRPPRVRYRLSEEGRTLGQLGQPVFLYLRTLERLQPPGESAEPVGASPSGTG